MPFVSAAGHSLHYTWIEGTERKPVLVFLHEGLGSIPQWREFPAKLAAATGCRALVYERYGHGQSDPLQEKRRSVRFMHDEALIALPQLLSALRIDNPILIGHSDGASIALIYAGAGNAARGLVVMAPHVFIERVCIDAIAKVAANFEKKELELEQKLGRYHRDPRKTFFGWADVWLDPEFKRWDIRDEYLPGVRCRSLVIQGYDDEYGTMVQLDEVAQRVKGPCEVVRLDYCGHTPFRDQPDKVLSRVKKFVRKVLT
jgi:pimeloyl-ACP methyl ester carboxylesterase